MKRQPFTSWFAIAGTIVSLSLSACATTRPPEPRIVTQEVRIAVPTPCNAQVERPTFPDTHDALQGAADVDRAVRLLGAGRALRDAYIAALEGALAACRDPTAPF